MNFYDNMFKVRLPSTQVYQLHQQIDTLIQEGRQSKLAYSCHFEPIPNTEQTLVQVRSAVALKLPGEKEVICNLKEGQNIAWQMNLCSLLSRGDKYHDCIDEQEAIEKLITPRLARAGFELVRADLVQHQIMHGIKKKRGRAFFIPYWECAVEAVVRDVVEAEQAMVYGIGKKRIFGLGMFRVMKGLNDGL